MNIHQLYEVLWMGEYAVSSNYGTIIQRACNSSRFMFRKTCLYIMWRHGFCYSKKWHPMITVDTGLRKRERESYQQLSVCYIVIIISFLPSTLIGEGGLTVGVRRRAPYTACDRRANNWPTPCWKYNMTHNADTNTYNVHQHVATWWTTWVQYR